MRHGSEFVGREFGVSGWITVDQESIDKFAESTGEEDIPVVGVSSPRKINASRSAKPHFGVQ